MVTMLKKRPGSESVGYGLKIPRIPNIMKVAYRGSCLNGLATVCQ